MIKTRIRHSRVSLACILATFFLSGCISTRENGPQSCLDTVRQFKAGELAAVEFAGGMESCMVQIPAGSFWMGSESGRDDEKPLKLVYIDAFEIDRFEVTNAQYAIFLQQTGRDPPQYWEGNRFPMNKAAYPVVAVDWENADAYCAWTGKRLPTEAEWEKACRSEDGRRFPWGESWNPSRANVFESDGDVSFAARMGAGTAGEMVWEYLKQSVQSAGRPALQPVGSYPAGASPYGVYDMVGNASEWVADWYNWDGYADLPEINPFNTDPPWNHVLRGSPWFDKAALGDWVEVSSRCSARSSSHVVNDPRVGFRCARSAADSEP